MAERVTELFAEYADAYARGERPEAREYLARAADEGDELARLIDQFVSSAPAPVPNYEDLFLTAAWLSGDPPLLELRRRRRLKRDQIVDDLIRILGIDARKREKVSRYYHRLENGLLNVEWIDHSVWDALAETLDARVTDLVARRPPTRSPQAAYFRVTEDAGTGMAKADAAAPTVAARYVDEPDEIDRLFGGPGLS